MRRILLLIGVLFFLWGCSFDLDLGSEPDGQAGDLGRLRFSSGGCSGSTVMAVGSRATIQLEPIEGALPDDLTVAALSPEVISVTPLGPDQVQLRAHAEGQGVVAAYSAGDIFDRIAFRAVPAAGVHFDAYHSVLQGGSLDVRVTEVYGACGTSDCLLLGHSFLDWRSEPAGAFELVLDDLGTAQLIANDSGEVVGREPARGADLLRTAVTVVPHAQVSGLQVMVITIPLEEGEVSVMVLLPGSVRTNQLLLLHVDGLRDGDEAVPISRRDVRWSVAGDLVQEAAQGHDGDPLGDLFLVGAEPGTVELEAIVDLLGTSATFTLTVEEG